MLAHLAKIEQRAASPTPETRYRESNADDPHERRDDDPAGHGWKGTRITRVVKEAISRGAPTHFRPLQFLLSRFRLIRKSL